jgi:uncharacterized membrane protein
VSNTRLVFRWLTALFFIVAGANHFRSPVLYLGMMPDWLPWPHAMNAISGAAEICGGVGLLQSATRRLAGWGLALLLVAVFPANLHVAWQGHMPGTTFSAATLWWRLLFQPLLIALVLWVSQRSEPNPRVESVG